MKDARGQLNGRKNLLDCLTRCAGLDSRQVQLKLSQCMKQKLQISKNDMSLLKQKQVEYCVDGYNSFKSVEHSRFLNLMQCVDFGAKYGKFAIAETVYSGKTVSRATVSMAAEVKVSLIDRLRSMVEGGTVSLS